MKLGRPAICKSATGYMPDAATARMGQTVDGPLGTVASAANGCRERTPLRSVKSRMWPWKESLVMQTKPVTLLLHVDILGVSNFYHGLKSAD